jgi:hypothetical protein
MTLTAQDVNTIEYGLVEAETFRDAIETALRCTEGDQFATFSNGEVTFLNEELTRYKRLATLLARGAAHAETKV